MILTTDKSGMSASVLALRVNKKKEGSSPFEKHMWREHNTVTSNLVRGLLNISIQNFKLEFDPTDFQEELYSTALVRERTRGSKLEGTFEKKTGKMMKESAHTLTMITEASNTPEVYSRRDMAAATKEEKENIEKKTWQRAVMAETTSSSENEEQSEKRKKMKTKEESNAP